MTIPYAEVIGDPVAHSKSPAIHKFWLEKLGLEGDYRATRVTADDLPDYLAARRSDPGWRGCNVTAPLKQEVLTYVDEVDPVAAQIGAMNTIARRGGILKGYNTDLAGFLDPIRSLVALPVSNGVAIVLGAGGAARAVVFGLARSGFEPLVLNRNPERARALTAECGGAWWDDLSIYDLDQNRALELHSPPWPTRTRPLLINATPLGMTGKPPLEISLDKVDSDSVVYDLVYSPLETPLLAEARRHGMIAISGMKMLVAQAALAFSQLFGSEAPRECDSELWALLSR